MTQAEGALLTSEATNVNEKFTEWGRECASLKFIDFFFELLDEQVAARDVIDHEQNSPEKVALVWAILLESVQQAVMDIEFLYDVCYDFIGKYRLIMANCSNIHGRHELYYHIFSDAVEQYTII